jgi:hypothetical protein
MATVVSGGVSDEQLRAARVRARDGQARETTGSVTLDPGVHGLPRDPVSACDFGDRDACQDFHDRVIALFDHTELHQHQAQALHLERRYRGRWRRAGGRLALTPPTVAPAPRIGTRRAPASLSPSAPRESARRWSGPRAASSGQTRRPRAPRKPIDLTAELPANVQLTDAGSLPRRPDRSTPCRRYQGRHEDLPPGPRRTALPLGYLRA